MLLLLLRLLLGEELLSLVIGWLILALPEWRCLHLKVVDGDECFVWFA